MEKVPVFWIRWSWAVVGLIPFFIKLFYHVFLVNFMYKYYSPGVPIEKGAWGEGGVALAVGRPGTDTEQLFLATVAGPKLEKFKAC